MRTEFKKVAGSLLVILFPLSMLAQISLHPAQVSRELREGERVWRAKKRLAFQTEWESYRFVTNAITGRIKVVTNSYVQLGSGLNVPTPDGQYRAARAEFTITPRGAEATNTIHKLILAPDIGSDGAVQLIASDGTELKSQPLGLGYYDPVSGKSIVLAGVTNALGWLVESNIVVYSNCFVGLRASILIRNNLSGMSHDVVLHEQPPPPEALGLSPQSRLEMFTEWLAGTPQPEKSERILYQEANIAVRQAMVEPDLTDTTIRFSTMRMGSGRAFNVGKHDLGNPETRPGHRYVPVLKLYEVMEGRNILVEGVEYHRVRDMLTNLPPASASGAFTNALRQLPLDSRQASASRLLPSRTLASLHSPKIQVADAVHDSGSDWLLGAPAFVLDYDFTELSGTQPSYILRGDETYFVSANFIVDDLTIQGGTVVKLNIWDTWMTFEVRNSLTCVTESYMPAIFTGKDDNSVGSALPGSTGNPAANRYGSPMLWISTPGDTELKHVRFSYANGAIAYFNWQYANTLKHAQVVHCWGSLYSEQANLKLQNVLFDSVDIPSESYLATITAEHVTAHTAFMLGNDYSGTLDFTVKNSLMVNLTQDDPNDYTVQNSQWLAEGPGIFQTVGLGSHYLADDTYRDLASPGSIDPQLLAELQHMTTHAPLVVPGTVTANTELLPYAPPDDDGLLDLGYHYPILDRLASGVQIQSGTLTVKDGAVIGVDYGFDSCGLRLGAGKLISQGSALKPNRFVRAHVVQEQTGATAPSQFAVFSDNPFPSTWSEARFRFTEFSGLADSGYVFYGGYYLGHFELMHSKLRNVALYANYYGLAGRTVGWTNNLWESAKVTLTSGQPLSVGLFNNLFTNATLSLLNGTTTWQVRDNIFDEGSVTCSTPVQNSHNGFVGYTSPGPFQNSGGGKFFTDLAYEEGPLGRYYLPQNIPAPLNLKEGGSRYADQAGLNHFTTSVGQEIEGASLVDIGYHHVSVDQSGQPHDLDGDGIWNYSEDFNGNGAMDPGETSYWLADTDGDGLSDSYEFAVTETAPDDPDSNNNGVPDGAEDADGDELTNLEESRIGTDPNQGNVASPLFNPFGGSYASAQSVAITCPTAGAVIHYTLNGAEPTESDPTINSGSAIVINTTLTLKAKAWKVGWDASDTESQSYRIEATPSNQAPTVSVLPAGGGSFLASDSIEILVEAADNDGYVAKIQLFRGNFKVAETATSPLRYNLDSALAGAYTFTAKAIDDAGAVTVSSPFTLTINAPVPVVSLVGAQPFFTSSPGTLLASIAGVNPHALANLTLNGAPLLPRTGEFPILVPLVEGANLFTLVATDSQSQSALDTTTVYLDSVLPVISITAPVNNSSFDTDRINVIGTFTEGSFKQITVNGARAFVSGSAFEALNVPLTEGVNTITATAVDIAGNEASASIAVNGSATPVDPVQLTATPVGGFVPLNVTFQVANYSPGTFQQVHYDFNGDHISDQTAANLNPIVHSYATAGEYFPVATIETTAGRFSSLGGWSAFGGNRPRINVQTPPVQQNIISVADPIDLKTTSEGHLYVLSRSTSTLTEYDEIHAVVRSVSGLGSTPTGLDLDGAGNVYVAVNGHHQVKKFNPTASAFQLDPTFGNGGVIGKGDQTAGSGGGEFNGPYDVAVSPGGQEIVVSDSGNHRMQRFSTDSGGFIGSFGEPGSGIGQFNLPKGLTHDEVGYLYVVDSGNNRVVLTLSLSFQGESGSTGIALGQFQGALNLALGGRGIYVADSGNHRVQAFDPIDGGHGTSLTPFHARLALSSEFAIPLNQPCAVAPVPDYLAEKIYIADTANNRVVLAELPFETPEAVWNEMKARVAASDLTGALESFSIRSFDGYREAFFSLGLDQIMSDINAIGALTPVHIENDEAQYYFEQVVEGIPLLFPVQFLKENGVWKILEF